MFKFASYATKSFWENTRRMLFTTASFPSSKKQKKKIPSDKQKPSQVQPVAMSLAGNLS